MRNNSERSARPGPATRERHAPHDPQGPVETVRTVNASALRVVRQWSNRHDSIAPSAPSRGTHDHSRSATELRCARRQVIAILAGIGRDRTNGACATRTRPYTATIQRYPPLGFAINTGRGRRTVKIGTRRHQARDRLPVSVGTTLPLDVYGRRERRIVSVVGPFNEDAAAGAAHAVTREVTGGAREGWTGADREQQTQSRNHPQGAQREHDSSVVNLLSADG